jgi:hypothetical protein
MLLLQLDKDILGAYSKALSACGDKSYQTYLCLELRAFIGRKESYNKGLLNLTFNISDCEYSQNIEEGSKQLANAIESFILNCD